MNFSSILFAAFLAVLLAVSRFRISWPAKKVAYLAGSYIFYASWQPIWLTWLFAITAVVWLSLRAIEGPRSPGTRRAWLLCGVSSCVVILLFGKFGESLVRGIIFPTGAPRVGGGLTEAWLVFPVGLSFYTFQAIGLLIDSYFGRIAPGQRLVDVALFLCFFPVVLAGPILRAPDFFGQLAEPRKASSDQAGTALFMVVLGLFEKVVLADQLLGPVVDRAFSPHHQGDLVSSWVGSLAFSGQIFFDFSGYSLCAIGVAATLGFVIPANFRCPYAASSLAEFWRRWHVSLSSWLRDYVFLPVAYWSNRQIGKVALSPRWEDLTTYAVASITTMTLAGAWHGSSWHFVVWGVLFGCGMALERTLGRRASQPGRTPLARLVRVGSTFLLVTLLWVFFRASDVPAALSILYSMLGVPSGVPVVSRTDAFLVAIVLILTVVGQWVIREHELTELVAGFPWWIRSLAIAAIIGLLVLSPGDNRAFIYFGF